ncbi:MAG: hypothetical protein P1U40_07370 [Coxiellaceae bacterium]|nr:hypothetical protein [Coxiellaceae bacterium]
MKLGEALCRWLLGNQHYLDLEISAMHMIIGAMKEQINSAALMCNYMAVAKHLATLRICLDAIKSKEPEAYDAGVKKLDPLITIFSCDLSRELEDIADAELERWADLEVVGVQAIIDGRTTEAVASFDRLSFLSKLLEGDADDLRVACRVMANPMSKLTSRLFTAAAVIPPKLCELRYALMDLGYDTSSFENRTGVKSLDAGGSQYWYDEQLFLKRIRKFAEVKDKEAVDWRLLADTFEASYEIDLLGYDYKSDDSENIVDQLSKGGLVNITVGWSLSYPRESKHGYILSLFSINGVVYLANCNRGGGGTSHGAIRFFKVNNSAALSNDDFYLKINAVNTTSKQYLLDLKRDGKGIGKDLGLEALPDISTELQWKFQKIGKCGVEVGKMKARMACAHQVLLANTTKPSNRSRLRKGEGVPFDMIIEALAESTPAYKHFRCFDRSESMVVIIDHLLNTTKSDEIRLTAAQRLVVFDAFINFVEVEHGGDDSPAHKRMAIFKPLDDYLRSDQGQERLSGTPYYEKFLTITTAALRETECSRDEDAADDGSRRTFK